MCQFQIMLNIEAFEDVLISIRPGSLSLPGPIFLEFFSRIFLGILSHLFSMNLSFQVNLHIKCQEVFIWFFITSSLGMWTFLKRFPSQVNKSDRTVSFNAKESRFYERLALAKEWVGLLAPSPFPWNNDCQVPTLPLSLHVWSGVASSSSLFFFFFSLLAIKLCTFLD